jgi:hypothetical protein
MAASINRFTIFDAALKIDTRKQKKVQTNSAIIKVVPRPESIYLTAFTPSRILKVKPMRRVFLAQGLLVP